jgi:hypothetical protein
VSSREVRGAGATGSRPVGKGRITRAYDDMVDLQLRMNLCMSEALPTGIAKYTGNRKGLRDRLQTIFDELELSSARPVDASSQPGKD